MFNVAVLLLGLLYSAYTDLKTGYVQDWLSHTMIGLGIMSVFVYFPDRALESLAVGAIVFAVGYVLYIYGNIGGGDVKLFTAIALLVPYYSGEVTQIAAYLGVSYIAPPYPFIVSVFLVSGILFMMFISVYYFIRVIRLRKKIGKFREKMFKGIVYAAILMPFFYYWTLVSFAMSLLYIPIFFTCMIIPFKDDFIRFFFAQKKAISKLDDDDIIAIEILDKNLLAKLGIKRRTHTMKELERIKANARKHRISTITVCENLPKFVPYILLSVIINLAAGDAFLYMLSQTSHVLFY